MGNLLERINNFRHSTDLRSFLRKEASYDDMANLFGEHADAVKLYAEVEEDGEVAGDSLIILLPGLMGSALADKSTGVIWVNPVAFVKGRLNALDLKADGKTDATPGVTIMAPNPLWMAYAKIVLRLGHGFEIHSFPYDWRISTLESAKQLQAFIDDKLAASPHDKVTLVGHSLGGLVAVDYLVSPDTRSHAEQHVQRAVTLGTPFKGAVLSVGILAGRPDPKMNAANKLNKANKPLQMVRSFPSMYYIMPAPRGMYDGWDPVPDVDVWDLQEWKDRGADINEDHLNDARAHHELLASADPQVPFINVVGVNFPTDVGIKGTNLEGDPVNVPEGPAGGDGTVEIQSAIFNDNAEVWYLNEEHTELVMDQGVIGSIMEWGAGGKATDLFEDMDKVRPDEGKLRSAAVEEEVDMDEIARKVEAGEDLTHAEMKALYTVV